MRAMQYSMCLLIVFVGLSQATAATADPRTTAYLALAVKPLRVMPGLPLDPYAEQQGEGTWYTADGTGNCGFPASPGNLMVAAMNNTDYGNSWACGAYVNIIGPNGSVTVRIVDRCPECQPGDIDLSQEAFAKIAALSAGRVPIRWRILSPALSGPIVYHFKDGSSQWWTAIQIRNHRNPIFSIEYQRSDGSWKVLERALYNYFIESSGTGPGPLRLRVTDIYGNQISDSNVPILDNADHPGGMQFPVRAP